MGLNVNEVHSYGAIFCECDCHKNGLCGCQWHCSYGAAVCAMSHMNGFHTHSVQLWFAILIQYVTIQITVAPCEQTTLNCKKKLSKNAVAKEINRTVWTSLISLGCYCHLIGLKLLTPSSDPNKHLSLSSASHKSKSRLHLRSEENVLCRQVITRS